MTSDFFYFFIDRLSLTMLSSGCLWWFCILIIALPLPFYQLVSIVNGDGFKLIFSQTLNSEYSGSLAHPRGMYCNGKEGNILFEISLLFRIIVKQTAIISCVMTVMITFWTKYLTQFFSCHIKVFRPYFLQTNSCILSKILLLCIS